MTDFVRCGQFEGSRDGWAFKTGTSGLGYYREGAPEVQRLLLAPLVRPLGELCKAELKLNDLIAVVGDPLRMTADDEPSRPHRMLPVLRNCNQEKNGLKTVVFLIYTKRPFLVRYTLCPGVPGLVQEGSQECPAVIPGVDLAPGVDFTPGIWRQE